MTTALKILILIAGIWAALHPAFYGVLFVFCSIDSSVIIDSLVFASCIIIVWDAFRVLPHFIWGISLIVLLIATNIGFFYHFPEFGESGPLPYEWLNEYYDYSLPLIFLTLFNRSFYTHFKSGKDEKSKDEK